MSLSVTVADYELRTGLVVPPDDQARVQILLDDAVALFRVSMGDCWDVTVAYAPGALRAMVISRVYYLDHVPVGVRSESIGSVSVTYGEALNSAVISASEAEALANLCALATTGHAKQPTGLTSIVMEIG